MKSPPLHIVGGGANRPPHSANKGVSGSSAGGIRLVAEASQPAENDMQQLERLHSLREKGVLDEDEYQARKEKLLSE